VIVPKRTILLVKTSDAVVLIKFTCRTSGICCECINQKTKEFEISVPSYGANKIAKTLQDLPGVESVAMAS
jgi:hypothetical protein